MELGIWEESLDQCYKSHVRCGWDMVLWGGKCGNRNVGGKPGSLFVVHNATGKNRFERVHPGKRLNTPKVDS